MPEADGAALVRLEGVSRRYESGLLALRDVDLAVPRQGFIAILGASGCGKSTLLRILAKLLTPTGGNIAWNEDKPRLGLVFQEPTLMPWARAIDNAALPLTLAGNARSGARAQARALLNRVGLGEFADAYPRALSGGMKMRVSLARALVTSPHLLLLDEPFAALDELTRTALNADLLALWQERGGAVVFVTHSVFEAVFLSERIYVMTPRPGRIATEIVIDEPYPRRADFRLSPAFATHVRAVSDALARAMAEAA